MNIAGETVLVTGASGNIGQGIARRLAEAGAAVVVHCYRNRESADRLAGEIDARLVVQGDLGNAAERDHCVGRADHDRQ
jgi:NAD(P)-dependent dehydrogenase (short-subunit alcohol dehydrogenase family)